jgi:hypothetical protein
MQLQLLLKLRLIRGQLLQQLPAATGKLNHQLARHARSPLPRRRTMSDTTGQRTYASAPGCAFPIHSSYRSALLHSQRLLV